MECARYLCPVPFPLSEASQRAAPLHIGGATAPIPIPTPPLPPWRINRPLGLSAAAEITCPESLEVLTLVLALTFGQVTCSLWASASSVKGRGWPLYTPKAPHSSSVPWPCDYSNPCMPHGIQRSLQGRWGDTKGYSTISFAACLGVLPEVSCGPRPDS